MKYYISNKIQFGVLSFIFAILLLLSACQDNEPTIQTGTIKGIAYDAITFEYLNGAEVVLEKTDASSSEIFQTQVDENGDFSFQEMPLGTYEMYLEYPGYKTMFCSGIDLTKGDAYVAFLPLANDIADPSGAISGIVLGENGQPVEGANISISAQEDSLTNGYFASVTSNARGEFFMGALPLKTTQEFKVRCIIPGNSIEMIPNISILQNEVVLVYFQMENAETFNQVFHETFESSTDGWEKTGFWHVQQNSEIFNQAYPEFVLLAPNDNSEGLIPDAYTGTRMMWYGEPSTGNYLGEQSSSDYPLSGGRSAEPNRGTIITPTIDLRNLTEASLNFWTWFEIESVNPNEFGYDRMEIHVITSDGNQKFLAKLNPHTDPILSDRKAIPYTSGGFNQAPVWKYDEYDLSEFAGSTIRIMFSFDTRDELFNGFRGWFLDEISVVDKAVYTPKTTTVPRPDMVRQKH
ncbi:MAG: carboxypeptidase regulatory-like domain-containing protein [Bacteroidota bacterium]